MEIILGGLEFRLWGLFGSLPKLGVPFGASLQFGLQYFGVYIGVPFFRKLPFRGLKVVGFRAVGFSVGGLRVKGLNLWGIKDLEG